MKQQKLIKQIMSKTWVGQKVVGMSTMERLHVILEDNS